MILNISIICLCLIAIAIIVLLLRWQIIDIEIQQDANVEEAKRIINGKRVDDYMW